MGVRSPRELRSGHPCREEWETTAIRAIAACVALASGTGLGTRGCATLARLRECMYACMQEGVPSMFPARLGTHKHAHTIFCNCSPTSKPDSQINRQKSMQFARTKIMLSRAGGGSDSSVPAPKAPCPLPIPEPHPSFVSRSRKAALRVRRAKDLSTPTTKASGRDLARFHVLPGVALVWRLPLNTLLNCT